MKDRDNNLYTAGLIDGEGSITLSNIHANTWRAPVVSFSSSSRELIDFFHNTYGGHIISKRVYAENHTPSWECRLTYNAALKFLERIYLYLKHEEKIYRAKLLLTQYKQVTPRNGKYSEQQKQAKLEFEHRFFHPSTP